MSDHRGKINDVRRFGLRLRIPQRRIQVTQTRALKIETVECQRERESKELKMVVIETTPTACFFDLRSKETEPRCEVMVHIEPNDVWRRMMSDDVHVTPIGRRESVVDRIPEIRQRIIHPLLGARSMMGGSMRVRADTHGTNGRYENATNANQQRIGHNKEIDPTQSQHQMIGELEKDSSRLLLVPPTLFQLLA